MPKKKRVQTTVIRIPEDVLISRVILSGQTKKQYNAVTIRYKLKVSASRESKIRLEMKSVAPFQLAVN